MEKGKDGFCRRRLSDEGGETDPVDGSLSDGEGETGAQRKSVNTLSALSV